MDARPDHLLKSARESLTQLELATALRPEFVDLRYRTARLCHRRISACLALLARVGG